MKCINCEQEIDSKFCPHCGHRSEIKRITFKEGWRDFWARIYGFDGMFPRTLRDLTLRPGKASITYMEGNRVKYYGPVGYFFLMITLWLLSMNFLSIDFTAFLSENQKAYSLTNAGEGQQQFTTLIIRFISENFKWIAFFSVPLDAVAARYIFFRKSGYNFLENTVLPFFIRGHLYWLSIVAVIYYKISGSLLINSLIIFISFFYFGWSYANFINYQPKWKSLLKGFGVFIASEMLLVLVAILVMFALILIDRDIFEMIRPSNNR